MDRPSVDRRAVNRWENGHYRPSEPHLFRLAEVFGVDVGWFYQDHQENAA